MKSREFFVLKTETSTLLRSEFLQLVKSYLKFRLWQKHSIADQELLDLSYTCTALCLLYVHKIKKVFNFATKNLYEPCYTVILRATSSHALTLIN